MFQIDCGFQGKGIFIVLSDLFIKGNHPFQIVCNLFGIKIIRPCVTIGFDTAAINSEHRIGRNHLARLNTLTSQCHQFLKGGVALV